MPDVVWKPHPRQAAFLSLPDTFFEALYGGAAGGGKSEALLNLPIVRGFYSHPRFKGILFRRTYPELEAELINRSENQGIYSGVGGRYNKEKRRWVFPSGSIIQFGHLEYDSDVRKYDSAEYSYIAFDELTSFTEYMYTYMFSRCRSASKNLPAIVRSGTNPGGIGHGWVRARFVEPAPYGTRIRAMFPNGSFLDRIFIQSKATDNPYLLDNSPNYLTTLQGMAEKDRRAKLDGDWYTFSGQVFDDYREENFPGEPANAVHVIDDFTIPQWWPKFNSTDWGFTAMTYSLWGALSPEGRLYLYREYSRKGAKISEWATDIGKLSDGETYTDAVMCRSAWQDRGEDMLIADKFAKYSGIRPRLADNNRISGKLCLQELFRWKPKPVRKTAPSETYSNEQAAIILRTKGMDAYKNYVISFEPEEPELNLPKLQIFRSLPILRKAIPLCVYDEDHKEDVAEFDGDDPYDTARYLGMAVDRYNFGRLQGKSDHLQKLAGVITDLEKNGDYTSFYRKLEALERKAPRPTRGIRRMHHASR